MNGKKIKIGYYIFAPEFMFLIYVIGMAGIQIVEMFTKGSYSRIIMLLLLLSIFLSIIINGRIKKGEVKYLIIILAFVGVYNLIYMGVWQYEIVNNLHAAILNMIIYPFIVFNLNFNKFNNWSFIEKLIFIYFCINLFLFIVRYPACFSPFTKQFQGASSDPNLLAVIIMAIVLLEFWGETRLSVINKILAFALIIVNGSRAYLVCIIGILFVNVITKRKRNNLTVIPSIIIFVSVLIILSLFLISIGYDIRLFDEGLRTNGRSYLLMCGYNAISKVSFKEILFGSVNLVKKYLSLSLITTTHSFGENSYLSLLMLFGLLGLGFFVIYWYTFWYMKKKIYMRIVLMIVLASFFIHDTILYTQGFVCLTGALIVLATDSRQLYIR